MASYGDSDNYVPPSYPDEYINSTLEFYKLAEETPQISAGMDKWALLTNGGLQCNSVPIQVQRWPFIIQRCERPIRARYLALTNTEYWNDFGIPIHKVYVSGKGKRILTHIWRMDSPILINWVYPLSF